MRKGTLEEPRKSEGPAWEAQREEVPWVGGPLTWRTDGLLAGLGSSASGHRPAEKASPFTKGFMLELWATLLLGLAGIFWGTECAAVGITGLVPHQFCVCEVMLFPQSPEPRERAPACLPALRVYCGRVGAAPSWCWETLRQTSQQLGAVVVRKRG